MRSFWLALFVGVVMYAQKSKITSAALALQDGDFERALSYIDQAFAQPDLLKPADMAKGYKIRAQAYIALLSKDPVGAQQKYPNLYQDTYSAIRKCRELDAKKEYEQDIKILSAQLASILYLKGFELFQKEQLPQAREYLTWATELYEIVGQKDFFPPIALRGLVNVQLRDTNAALADLEKALALSKAKPMKDAEQLLPFIYMALINIYGGRGQGEKAITLANEARSKFPTDENIRRAELNLYLQNPALHDEALKQFGAELEKNPNNEMYLLIYAQLLERKNPDSAAVYYKRVLGINPNNVNANYNLGAYYVNQAAELAQKYNEAKNEDQQKVLYNQMQEKFREALPYLEKAHEALPTDLALLQSLIQVTTYLNMDDKAKEYLRKKEALTSSKGK